MVSSLNPYIVHRGLTVKVETLVCSYMYASTEARTRNTIYVLIYQKLFKWAADSNYTNAPITFPDGGLLKSLSNFSTS